MTIEIYTTTAPHNYYNINVLFLSHENKVKSHIGPLFITEDLSLTQIFALKSTSNLTFVCSERDN